MTILHIGTTKGGEGDRKSEQTRTPASSAHDKVAAGTPDSKERGKGCQQQERSELVLLAGDADRNHGEQVKPRKDDQESPVSAMPKTSAKVEHATWKEPRQQLSDILKRMVSLRGAKELNLNAVSCLIIQSFEKLLAKNSETHAG